jgi:hypothetical protein
VSGLVVPSAIRNVHYLIEWVYSVDFPGRPIPLVILRNGEPGFVINQWIYYQLESGISPSLLEERIRAVLHLYEYCCRRFGKAAITAKGAQSMLADFITAKKRGTIAANGSDPLGLYWKPNFRLRTLKRTLASINHFDKWHSTYHGAQRLNPDEERFLAAWERFRDFKRRSSWDPLVHLFSSKSQTNRVHGLTLHESHSRFIVGSSEFPKAFPLERFIELVDSAPSPRDQMFFLLCGGASLRQSEPLHLFHEDILGSDDRGQPRIRIADPERGRFSWSTNGVEQSGTREEFLKTVFQNDQFKFTIPALYALQPRTRGKRGKDHVGFKGMTFGDDPLISTLVGGRQAGFNELFWIDPRFGYRFALAYVKYVRTVFHGKPYGWPHHPWLFLNLDRDSYGMPMTIPAVRKAWIRAMKRLGMLHWRLGPHSLRHMFGYYCASILRLPLEITKVLMHHGAVESTQKYYHLRSDEVRNAIISAVIQHGGINVSDYLILPGAPRLQFPEHWERPVDLISE